MKMRRTIIVSIALAAALAIPAGFARAQDPVTAAAVAAPIVTKVISAAVSKKNPSGNWFKGEVIHFDANSLIVREEANERAIHTFTFAPELKDKMQQLVDAGGYQYGDKVKILYQQNNTVAVKVVGKPSKPL
jgi:ABC-type sugar transport system substrate-binding protein